MSNFFSVLKIGVYKYFFVILVFGLTQLRAQVGYTTAPYIRYEADAATLTNATITARSYNQSLLQSEASNQQCVTFSSSGATAIFTTSANSNAMVLRYSVPDGQSAQIEVYANNVLLTTLTLGSYYSWESLATNGDPNNVGITNTNARMRFDEVRYAFPSTVNSGGQLKLVRVSGSPHIDFIELETRPPAITAAIGDVMYTGNGSDLQTFINSNGGKTIFIPAGTYNISTELYFGVANTKLKGAGSWYTNLHFTGANSGQGGLRANANGISFSGLYLTTSRNSRTNSYHGINGVYTATSAISDIWAEHFQCGAWIGQYNTGSIAYADGFTLSNCRFRNNYADGINLCKGTRNAIVEYCSFRNNGDDDMAIWSANGLECQNNIIRYSTSENCWRASGCALYGGYNNKFQNILIRDNLEVGIRVNNTFSGVGFNVNGLHEFTNITIERCGTFNDVYNSPVGAIDLVCTDQNGTRINNVKFSSITITDSKNDGIYINKKSGEGFYNLIFENITINGTGKEYPDNNINNLNWGRGYFVLFVGYPSGSGTYCNMTYSNRGGNATVNESTIQKGTFTWTSSCVVTPSVSITSPSVFGVCDNPYVFQATATPPGGNSISYIEFFLNGNSLGTDNTAPYNASISTLPVGNHNVHAVAYYSPSSASSTSYTQSIYVSEGFYQTTSSIVADGNIEMSWNSSTSRNLSQLSIGTISGSSDASAYYKVLRDNTNLYILVDVTDDVLLNDSPAGYNDDAVELFIDIGNDKSGTYGTNDFAFMCEYNTGVITESKHNAIAGITHALVARSGGYRVEVIIPWSTLGGKPAEGSLIGIDVHVNDDDDGGNRDAKIVWKDATDNAWQNPSLFGTLQLANCVDPLLYLSTNDQLTAESNLSVYPNPSLHSFTIKSEIAGFMEIFNCTGSLIHTSNISTTEYFVGEDFPPGIYTVKLNTLNGVLIQRILKQ